MILCFYDTSAFIKSEVYFRHHYSAIVIKFEHCIEYEDPKNCASEVEALRFWKAKNVIKGFLPMI